jgi:hypothetical protein
MAGADLEQGAVDAFHAAFRAVILTCAVLAGLAGIIGGLTAPKRQTASSNAKRGRRPQKTE